jgi:hypothetical protein
MRYHIEAASHQEFNAGFPPTGFEIDDVFEL